MKDVWKEGREGGICFKQFHSLSENCVQRDEHKSKIDSQFDMMKINIRFFFITNVYHSKRVMKYVQADCSDNEDGNTK